MTHHVADSVALPEQGRVLRETAGGIATVTFGHPKGNSLPAGLLRRLADEVAEAGRDPEARVILLRSEGAGPFCAGASFDELVAIGNAEEGKEFFLGFARVILAMIRAPKPVVVRVHGKVVGGGVGVVAAADLAHAVGGASARLSELAVGIGPFVVAPAIERKLGQGPLGAMSADTAWRDAEWCERHGLYTAVHPDVASLDAALGEVTSRLVGFNPDALAELKAILWSDTEDWDALLEERAKVSGRLVLSEFTRAAIERFRSR